MVWYEVCVSCHIIALVMEAFGLAEPALSSGQEGTQLPDVLLTRIRPDGQSFSLYRHQLAAGCSEKTPQPTGLETRFNRFWTSACLPAC